MPKILILSLINRAAVVSYLAYQIDQLKIKAEYYHDFRPLVDHFEQAMVVENCGGYRNTSRRIVM